MRREDERFANLAQFANTQPGMRELPKCRGDTCKQGRASCRTPQACGLIYSGRKHEGMARRFVIRGLLLCLLAAAYWWTK